MSDLIPAGDRTVDDDTTSRDHRTRHAEQPDAGTGARRARTSRKIPTETECLQGLAALNEMLVLRLLSSAQASAIRANFKELLAHHRQHQRAPSGQKVDGDLLSLAQGDPKIAAMLEPFLSDEQIDRFFPGSNERKA
jgi:hypothetical protein